MIKSISKVTAAFFMLLATSNCATIFKGSSADIRVNSDPAGATVMVNEIDRGKTPLTLSLSRNSDYILHFKKEGFEDVKLEVKKKFDGATTIAGNIFSWGLLGIVVDVATGAAYTLKPADVTAHMEKLKDKGVITSNMDENSIQVFMLTKAEWETIQAN